VEVLSLPYFEFRFQEESSGIKIWDEFRRKYVVLTPEEWVRQNFLMYLHFNLNYPKSLIKIESGLKYNQKAKRSDILAYDQSGKPLLLVECKSTKIQITSKVFEQASVYNKTIQAKYLVITNGVSHFCCEQNFESGKVTFLKDLPEFPVT